jgi:nitrite reductase/ring-hydroxylating ferredoxin subunit
VGLILLSVLLACDPQLTDDPIPLVTFQDQVCNLALPDYSSLRNYGGFMEMNKIGLRGVILYRVDETTIRAYERNCSFHPNDAGATVNIHTSSLYMIDSSCGSTFNFTDGQPTGGPAWRPLRQYRTTVQGNILTITSEIVN